MVNSRGGDVGTVFVTHCHTDHIAAIIGHARAASMRKITPKYFVPAGSRDAILAARTVSVVQCHECRVIRGSGLCDAG